MFFGRTKAASLSLAFALLACLRRWWRVALDKPGWESQLFKFLSHVASTPVLGLFRYFILVETLRPEL
jgi:hypothetical protein